MLLSLRIQTLRKGEYEAQENEDNEDEKDVEDFLTKRGW
jgi:hypothetical protein